MTCIGGSKLIKIHHFSFAWLISNMFMTFSPLYLSFIFYTFPPSRISRSPHFAELQALVHSANTRCLLNWVSSRESRPVCCVVNEWIIKYNTHSPRLLWEFSARSKMRKKKQKQLFCCVMFEQRRGNSSNGIRETVQNTENIFLLLLMMTIKSRTFSLIQSWSERNSQ